MFINDYPISFPIKRIVDECTNVKTFYLDARMDFLPGQFVMLWIPGYDEKPFALTTANSEIGITVKKRGAFTKRLFEMKKGELLGVRGPYGNGFQFRRVNNACIVAGGIGIAALVILAEELAQRKAKIDFVFGCKSKEGLLFPERVSNAAKLYTITEDGSCGKKGYCTEPLKELLKENKYEMLYCCGPEPMMKSVLELCNKFNVPAQFSVERYMKCCTGICGQCSLDEHLCCIDGPVFTREQLNKSKEFSRIHYEKTGRKIKL